MSCGSKDKNEAASNTTTESNQKKEVENEMETFDSSKITKLSIWVANEEKFTENKEVIQQFFSTDCKYKRLENYENRIEGGFSFDAYDENGKKYGILIVEGNKFDISEYDGMGSTWYEISNNPDYSEIVGKIKQENGIEEQY